MFFCIFKIGIKFRTFSKKKMTLIADFFPKLRTPENVARYMSKKSRFKEPFDRQRGKRVQRQLQSGKQLRCHIY